ncbi:hypothetical protein [Parabacteroides merdae]|uniref:hypothetical protein n=1 Tax=Parabacteroides merdae TaxID=46503 RepID=UPI0022E5B7F9|nr:hypothetical protein [Parabacteroides merdae]
MRSDSAGSGRSVFALRLTPIRLGLSKKAPLSLGMADTASYISIATSICIPPKPPPPLFCRLLKQAASAIPKEPSGSTSGLSW